MKKETSNTKTLRHKEENRGKEIFFVLGGRLVVRDVGKETIILTGGGTGGHIFPAIAIARELSKHPEVELLYVGKQEGLESKWVPDSGFAFEGVSASGFPRGLSVSFSPFGSGSPGGWRKPAVSRRASGRRRSSRPEATSRCPFRWRRP